MEKGTNTKRKPKFVRKDSNKKLRLGKLSRKDRKWRRSRGRHAKIRKKRKGYLKAPSIGYGAPSKTKGFIAGAKPKLIFNVEQFKKIKENEIIVIGKIGEKKKADIAKEALKSKIRILNLKADAFLKDFEKKIKEKETQKETRKKAEKKEVKKEKETVEKEKPGKKEGDKEKEKIEKEKMLKHAPEGAKPKITKMEKPPEIKRKALEK